VRGQQRKDFFNGGSVIVDYGLIFWPEAAVSNSNVLIGLFFKHTMFHLNDVNIWAGVMWITCGLL